jgi:hypothetical protein
MAEITATTMTKSIRNPPTLAIQLAKGLAGPAPYWP